MLPAPSVVESDEWSPGGRLGQSAPLSFDDEDLPTQSSDLRPPDEPPRHPRADLAQQSTRVATWTREASPPVGEASPEETKPGVLQNAPRAVPERYGTPVFPSELDPRDFESEFELEMRAKKELPVHAAPSPPPFSEEDGMPPPLEEPADLEETDHPHQTPVIAGPGDSASVVARSLKLSASPLAPGQGPDRRMLHHDIDDPLDEDQSFEMIRDPKMEATVNFEYPPEVQAPTPSPPPHHFQDAPSPRPPVRAFPAEAPPSHAPHAPHAPHPVEPAFAPAPPGFERPPLVRTASHQRRSISGLIDGIVTVGSIVCLMEIGMFGHTVAAASLTKLSDLQQLLEQGQLWVPLSMLIFWWLTYAAFFDGFVGKTLGKFLTGVELVTAGQGTRPGMGRCFLRAMFGLMGFFAMGVGYVWILIDGKARGLHDIIARTVVVVNATEH